MAGKQFKIPISEVKDTEILNSIPEKDREMMLKHNPELARRMGIKPDKQETVSKFRYDELEKAAKEEREKLNTKIGELQKQRSEAVKDKNDFEERFNAKRRELEKCQEELGKLKDDYRRLSDEADELRKRPASTSVQDGMELRQLRKDVQELEKERESLREVRDTLKTENSELQTRLSESEDVHRELEERIQELNNRILDAAEPRMPELKEVGTASMDSPTTLRSSLFTAPRYAVKVARDMSYMKIRPDIDGKVINNEGSLLMPRLPEFMPYSDRRYSVQSSDGDTLVIELS